MQKEQVMKKMIFITTLVLAAVFSAPVFAAEYATITKVQTNWENVQVPQTRQECTVTEVPIYGQSGNGEFNQQGAIVGGIVGGLLGNQVGKGSGKEAATGVGALAGAIIGGNRQGQRTIVGYNQQRQCNDVTFYETQERVRNYTIWYEWNGVQARSYTYNQYSVGDQIQVTISINAR